MAAFRDELLLKKIAKRIKELREERKITQEVFYHDTGIHIARIESIKANLNVSTLKAICKYFNITLTEFFASIEK